jgi:hypothetical protein
MSIQKNINTFLDKNFENTNFLPQRLFLEDVSEGLMNFIKGLNLVLEDSQGRDKNVPTIYLTQERWAEYKKNWSNLLEKSGEEMVMPFMALIRNGVKQGTGPLKRTIPKKKKFTFFKVPTFDGSNKGFDLIKIPQPVWVDVEYELRFLTHYLQDVDKFYETVIMKGFSDLQGYIKINGYDIPVTMSDPSEDNTVDDITTDRRYQIIVPLKVVSRLVDPTKFERVKTINRISITMTEKN